MSARISLSASGASRWTSCTASPSLIAKHHDKIPKEEDAPEYTKEGILAHALAASQLLLGKNKADDYPSIEMMRYVNSYCQFVQNHLDERDTLVVEGKVPLFYMPERNGYIDAGIFHNQRVVVIDLKYGEGVSVSAFRNKQLATYARSIIESKRGEFDFNASTAVTIIIFQPRVFRGEKVSTWEITLSELVKFTDEIAEVARAIEDEWLLGLEGEDRVFTKFTPSFDNCRFCPAAGFCKAVENDNLDGLDVLQALANGDELVDETALEHYLLGDVPPSAPEPNVMRAAELMDPATRVRYVDAAPRLRRWLDRLEEYTYARLASGHKEDAPGKKLVDGGAGQRYWNDEREAERLLRKHLTQDERMPRKLISPAQAEEALKDKDRTEQFNKALALATSKRTRGLLMVDESDPRSENAPRVQAELEFEPLSDEEENSLEEDILCDMLT